MVHLSSSANPRSTDHISFIYALHVDDHLEAGSSLCLPQVLTKGRVGCSIRGVKGVVFSFASKGWFLTTRFVLLYHLSTTLAAPLHIKGQLQDAC